MRDALFTPEFRDEPYWWDDVPRPRVSDPSVPARADVAVIGAGYTGLCAALQTTRGGRDTVVFDAEAAGFGCSTRNGGQISTSIKPSFEELSTRFGAERAFAILREGPRALAWIGEFIADEGIDCDFTVCGRFHAAHSATQYDQLARAIAAEPPGLETDATLVPRDVQRSELGTDAYFGGVVYPRHASLHPARYHQGLLERVQHAGARVIPHCPVAAIERNSDGFDVRTASGVLRVRDVILATNGYTGPMAPWHRRRVIPIGSYIIATEALPVSLVDELIPHNRIVSDTRKVVYYYRASPDRTRVLFGGRVSLSETDPRRSAPRLHRDMVAVFPQLASTRVSHSWVGFVAYTFDTLAHIGVHEGVHYAMGYCGSGVSMASYLGMRVGRKVLGASDGDTGFDGLRFQTRPLYTGNPWFLAPSVFYYRWRDRLKG